MLMIAAWPVFKFNILKVKEIQKPSNIIFYSIGIIFILSAVIQFVKRKTTVNPTKPHKTTTLVITGTYKITRNPMYLGMALILLGLALMFNMIGGILFTLLFAIYITKFQIKPEEEVMERLFGEDFLKYKLNVRMWL